ncbi:TniQ family protein, partial [Acinetobacter baumannii]
MWNFPTPLPNELIYSTVARAGLHHGIQSPKQLLDEVFQDRKVVATVDLPSHLNAIVHLLQRTDRFVLIDLIYKHTMFGLYAPFVQESHRLKAITLMTEQASGSVHLMFGLNASRVPNKNKFHYCPICIQQQRETYGEYFWNRAWFVPNLPICLKHNCSLLSQDYIQQQHRHLFLPLLPNQTQDLPEPYFKEDFILGQMSVELLQLDPQPSPSHEQWTKFYLEIADAKNCRRGSQVRHEQTYEQVINKFKYVYLNSKNLGINPDQDTSWLKTIFRKHRKAFSFLEHCIVWSSFIPEMTPKDILQYVSSISANQYFVKRPTSTDICPNIKS